MKIPEKNLLISMPKTVVLIETYPDFCKFIKLNGIEEDEEWSRDWWNLEGLYVELEQYDWVYLGMMSSKDDGVPEGMKVLTFQQLLEAHFMDEEGIPLEV